MANVAACIAQHDALLSEFAGTRRHEVGETFWSELLTFPVPLTRLPPIELEAATTPYCERIGG